MTDVPEADTGVASALLSTFQAVGGTVGVAVVAALAAGRTADELAAGPPPLDARRAPRGTARRLRRRLRGHHRAGRRGRRRAAVAHRAAAHRRAGCGMSRPPSRDRFFRLPSALAPAAGPGAPRPRGRGPDHRAVVRLAGRARLHRHPRPSERRLGHRPAAAGGLARARPPAGAELRRRRARARARRRAQPPAELRAPRPSSRSIERALRPRLGGGRQRRRGARPARSPHLRRGPGRRPRAPRRRPGGAPPGPASSRRSTPVLLWGYSEGGRNAAWAAELQPDVRRRSWRSWRVAAGGVPADLYPTALAIDGGPFSGLNLAVLVGLANGLRRPAALVDPQLEAAAAPPEHAATLDVVGPGARAPGAAGRLHHARRTPGTTRPGAGCWTASATGRTRSPMSRRTSTTSRTTRSSPHGWAETSPALYRVRGCRRHLGRGARRADHLSGAHQAAGRRRRLAGRAVRPSTRRWRGRGVGAKRPVTRPLPTFVRGPRRPGAPAVQPSCCVPS